MKAAGVGVWGGVGGYEYVGNRKEQRLREIWHMIFFIFQGLRLWAMASSFNLSLLFYFTS